MRGLVLLLVIFGATYVLAAGTRRLFLSDVVPIAFEEAPQSMWALDAAFLLRAFEYIAAAGFAIALVIVLSQWARSRGRPAP
jgi:hypothetical protein